MAIPVNTYNKHTWVDNSSPDLEAEILNEIETGIKDNNDAIKAIAAAVVSQIVNDPDKIASMAALYAVNQTLGTLSTTVTNINSNLTNVINNHGNAFPRGDRLHLQVNGNLGFTEILKNSNSTADYGTIIANYMQDGGRTAIILEDTGIRAVKTDSSGSIISNKLIVTF